MDCEEMRRRIVFALDGELDAPAEAALDAHLEACPACRQFRQTHATARAALRRAASYHRAPFSLREAIAGALPGAAADDERRPVVSAPPPRHPAARTGRGGGWLFGWRLLNGAGLVAAACAAIALAVLLPQRPSADERLAEAVVAAHARALLTGHALDVASSDRHAVKPWFSGRLDFSPPVRDFGERGFPLAGARLDYLERRAVAVLVYRHRQHVIDVFVWPADEMAQRPPARTLQGYHVLGKTASGMNFRAVSDVEADDLQRLVDLL
ncbi:MAG: transcriptional regulator [Candidatus Accumulibacter sp.]|nr:transcriptional regulator [Accumulibacter sp.]